MRAIVGLLAVCALSSPAMAQDIVVPDDQPTIGDAIAAASDGDEIMVRDGDYDENVVVDKNVRIFSENGPAVTRILGADTDPLPVRFSGVFFSAAPEGVHLEGFTVDNDKGPATTPLGMREIGILVEPYAAPGLRNLWITGNADHGVVTDCSGGQWTQLWVFGNGNSSLSGGGIHVLGNTPNAPLALSGSVVEGNSGAEGGGFYGEDVPGGCWVMFTSTGNEWRDNAASGSGGAIYVEGAPSDFQAVTLDGDQIHDNTASLAGGGVTSVGLGVALAGCDVADNVAGGSGGGLAVDADDHYGVTLTLAATTVKGNDAQDDGGGIWVDTAFVEATGGEVSLNAAAEGDGGGFAGVVSLTGFNPPSWSFDGTNFAINEAVQGSGGAIHGSDGNLTLQGVLCLMNSAAGVGGAVAWLDGGFASISASELAENVAGSHGGAFYTAAGGSLTDATLKYNTALGDGGGVYADGGYLTVNGGEFFSNTADFAGGGLYVGGAAVGAYVTGVTLDSNQVANGGFGGAICMENGVDTSISGNVISNNDASIGGGVYISMETVGFESNRLIDNVADIDGGGAYLDLTGETASQLNFFGGNQALSGDGGGLYVGAISGPHDVTNTIFTANTASGSGGNAYLATDGDFHNNDVLCGKASTGGGVYAFSGGRDFRNNIVAWTTEGDGLVAAGGTSDYNIYFMNTAADVVGLTLGAGSMAATDPVFADPGASCDGDFTNDNYYLGPTSPAIDAGDPAPGFDDYDGSQNDIGAIGGNYSCFVDIDGDGDWACDDCDDTDASLTSEDADGDGVSTCAGDCDDADPANFPGNPEVCDGADNDCDPSTWAAGEDTNGDADPAPTCMDCDDGDSQSYPGAVELFDGVDNDCSGAPAADEVDSDGDGFLDCEDCNRVVATVCPDSTLCPEVCGDGVDNDCDGATDDGALCACPPDSACDDGDPCTEDDTCSASGACEGTPITCPDGELCAGGVCTSPPPDEDVTQDIAEDVAVPDADVGPDAESDAVAEPEPDAVADAESDVVADAESDAVADAESDATADAKSDAAADAKSDAAADAESDATIDGAGDTSISADVGTDSGGGGTSDGCDCKSGDGSLPRGALPPVLLVIAFLVLRRRR